MDTRTRRTLEAWFLCAFAVAPFGSAYATTAEEDIVWTGGLREAYFAEREIRPDDLITLDAPKRAENAAIVPISISAGIPQTPERYIRTIWLFVDKNPAPLVGRFSFTPASGRADLSLRLRVDAYSPVRAIAETNDGVLHMSRRFVKASGGCSAPASSDVSAARERLGEMKFLVQRKEDAAESGEIEGESRTIAQLMIRHPNLSGLQMNQVTQLYAPAEFVKQVKVSYEGEQIFHAETGFAVSENPTFRFYFAPQQDGVVTVEAIDTDGREFVAMYDVSPASGRVAARP